MESFTFNQVGLHILPTRQFKTHSIVINIQQVLSKDLVSQSALLPMVMKRGTRVYPEPYQLKNQLADLYGAGFQADVMKRGEREIIQFRMEIANGSYFSDERSLLEEGLELLNQILYHPKIVDGGFDPGFLEAEKKNLTNRIHGLLNDKISYAAEKSIAAMCQDEPYGTFILGDEARIKAISGEQLYTYYRELMASHPIDIYLVGDFEVERVKSLIQEKLEIPLRSSVKSLPETIVYRHVKEIKKVVEEQDVNQGNLNLGLRTNTRFADDDYPAMFMYNAILGGFAHSKLFVNVREKASLAYYASSKIESHKGIITIQSGIKPENEEKALKIIRQQLDDMRRGDISDDEMKKTISVLTNQLKEIKDRPFELINYHYHSVLGGTTRTLEQFMQAIRETTRDDVIDAAQKVELDTIYFLRNKTGS
jgi:predicted Zn-dependent peptidase